MRKGLRPGGDEPSQAAARRQNYAKGLEKAKEAVALAPEEPLELGDVLAPE